MAVDTEPKIRTVGSQVSCWFLIDFADDDRAALSGAFLTVAAKLQGPDGEQALVLFRRKGKRAFEAEAQTAEQP